jgi:serine/threonine protein phosphatase PrpC
MSYRFHTTSLTHEGLVRANNEDALLVREDAGLWAVADGMGGFKNGRWASGAVVSALKEAPIKGGLHAVLDETANAVQAANSAILQEAERTASRMGSTVAVLVIDGSQFGCVWAGDSRIYLFRDGALVRLSRDHTHAESMVERGLLTLEEARTHPMGHVLSRAVGVEPNLQLEAIVDQVQARDVFMLCSDGLTHLVADSEIADQLRALTIDQACAKLLELVMARGAPDNVTMIGVVCEEKTQLIFGETVG